jgi:hypothetical protein
MLLYQRMKRLYPLKPHTRKGNAEDRHQLKVPQYAGSPGWLLLSHSDDGTPIALFADNREHLTSISLILDERMFSDTVLRVVRVGPSRFLVYDVRYLNGRFVYETKSYEQRKELIVSLLAEFHSPDLVSLQTVEDVLPHEFPLRGYELYDSQPGTMGVFLPVKE